MFYNKLDQEALINVSIELHGKELITSEMNDYISHGYVLNGRLYVTWV